MTLCFYHIKIYLQTTLRQFLSNEGFHEQFAIMIEDKMTKQHQDIIYIDIYKQQRNWNLAPQIKPNLVTK